MSEAYGVGTLTLFRVSTRGVFMFMGISDTFLAIFMLIYGLCLLCHTFAFHIKVSLKKLAQPITNKRSMKKYVSISGFHYTNLHTHDSSFDFSLIASSFR